MAHPDQVVVFPMRGPRREGVRYGVVDEAGRPVVHQWLRGGELAVRLDGGLPAGSTRFWRVVENGPAAPAAGAAAVTVTESGSVVEIGNGLVVVRVPALAAAPTQAPAPIQALRLADGAWTAPGGPVVAKDGGQPLTVRAAALEFLERGPLRTSVRIVYRVDRSAIGAVVAAGVGEHATTATVEAGQPSILVEQDADVDASWTLDLSVLAPDEARYQGHSATSRENGQRADGSVYPPLHERNNEDAVVALPLRASPANPFGRYLPRWDPWIVDNGWYWQFYRRAGGEGTSLVGLFAGAASRAVGAQYSGVLIQADAPGRLVLRVDTERGRPPARVWPRNRFAWGIFVGRKADLRPPAQPQPIAQQMSLHGGFDLGKLAGYDLERRAIDAAAGLYLDGASLRGMIDKLRAEGQGRPAGAYYARLTSEDPALKPLWDAWADATGAAARALGAAITGRARKMLNAFVNGNGIYDFEHHYWHGGLVMSRDAVMINGLLILAGADTAAVPSELREGLERVATLYAHLLWDDDFVPLQEGHGLNLGTPNMPVMQASYRQLYALWLARHPAMTARAAEVRRQVSGLLASVVHDSGASIGSSGYILASLAPLTNTLQQIKAGGGDNPFRAEPRIARAAEYYLNLLTPREARFGGRRKSVSFGDGNTLGTELWGQLGTGLRGTDDLLSAG